MSRTLQLLTSSRTACLLLCLVLVLETQRCLVFGKIFEDKGATVTSSQFYGQCKNVVNNFNDNSQDSEMFCDCIRSGNNVESINSSASLQLMRLHSFLPLTNKLQYPAGEQLKWATYLSLFHINSYADERFRIHTQLWDTNCSSKRTSDSIAEVILGNYGSGIIGPSCSDVSELANSFTPFMSSANMGFAVEATELNNRLSYPSFYRLASPATYYVSGLIPISRAFNWTKVSAVIQNAQGFQDSFQQVVAALNEDENMELETVLHIGVNFNTEFVWRRLTNEGARIILLMVYQQQTEMILCAAYHRGIRSHCGNATSNTTQYVFMMPGWYPPKWYNKTVKVYNAEGEYKFNCTAEQMAEVAENSITMGRQYYRLDREEPVEITSNLNMTANRWIQLTQYVSKHCYFDGGSPSSPLLRTDPDPADAAVHDSIMMYYKGFKLLDKEIKASTRKLDLTPSYCGFATGCPSYPYTELNTDFNYILGRGLLGVRWYFIYLLGTLEFQGLSGNVTFHQLVNTSSIGAVKLPGPRRDVFFNDTIRPTESRNFFTAFVKGVLNLDPATLLATNPTRPITTYVQQTNASGEYVHFATISPSGRLVSLDYNKLTWPKGCPIPNSTVPEPKDPPTVFDRSCNLIPQGLADAMGGCAEAVAFIIGTAVGIMVLVVVALGLVWRKWYGKKLKKRFTASMTVSNEDEIQLQETMKLNSKWEIPREKVIINRRLGEGAFGAVFGGEMTSDSDEEICTGVAVKAMHEESTAAEKREFLAEGQLMTRFDHENIVKLIGFCTKEEPYYVIMELMMHGDLKGYLLSYRHLCGTGDPSELHTGRLTSMIHQVARGLRYLAEINFVHRDIAARNCMVTCNYAVKIGDFGMARKMYNTDYYRIKAAAPLPVRWMSRESLLDGAFTLKSDMWSFGVVVWEVITFGALPFPGLNNGEVIEAVRNGTLLSIPKNCPPTLKDFILACWTTDPCARMTADAAVMALEDNQSLVVSCVEAAARRRQNNWQTVRSAIALGGTQTSIRLRRAAEQSALSASSGAGHSRTSPSRYLDEASTLPHDSIHYTEEPTSYGSAVAESSFTSPEVQQPLCEDVDDMVENDGYMNTDLA